MSFSEFYPDYFFALVGCSGAFNPEADFLTSTWAFYDGLFLGKGGVTSSTGFAHTPTIWKLPKLPSLPTGSNIKFPKLAEWVPDFANKKFNKIIFNIAANGFDRITKEPLGNAVDDGFSTTLRTPKNALVISNLQLPNAPAGCVDCRITVASNGDFLTGPTNPSPGSRINLKVSTDDLPEGPSADPYGLNMITNIRRSSSGRLSVNGVTIRMTGKGRVPIERLKVLGISISTRNIK